MQAPPAGIPSRCIDHLADLVVTKDVKNPSATFLPMAGLMQQETLQGFIQGGESFLRCKLDDLAELLKGEVLLQDCSCCQQGASRRRQSGQATLDQLAHVRREQVVR